MLTLETWYVSFMVLKKLKYLFCQFQNPRLNCKISYRTWTYVFFASMGHMLSVSTSKLKERLASRVLKPNIWIYCVLGISFSIIQVWIPRMSLHQAFWNPRLEFVVIFLPLFYDLSFKILFSLIHIYDLRGWIMFNL